MPMHVYICHRAILRTLAVLVGLLLLLSHCYDIFSNGLTHIGPRSDTRLRALKVPDFPDDYRVIDSSEAQWCQDRFGLRHLENTRDSFVSYCSDDSASQLTCFLSSTAPGESKRIDAMCYGRHAVYDKSANRFRIGCDLRPLTPDELARGAPDVPENLPRYWYETGPGFIMKEAVVLDKTVSIGKSQLTTILLKREGTDNLWHSLMEVMSLSWSLDILQMSLDNLTGEPFLAPTDGATTQVVLVDRHENVPFVDLWNLFAKMPIRRIQDLNATEPVSNIIIPFAGGSNTLWQGDWEDLLCRDSSLVKTFVSRVVALFEIATPVKDDDQVVVTYIRRTNTRKLLDEDTHMQALREAIPHINLQVIDFATIPFVEQLAIIRGTDLLIGVHGAGLTHLMFLQPASALLEILPENFQHKGFRNLAQMMGIGYFRAHAKMHGDASGDHQWQFDAIEIDRQRLISLVEYGVKSLYNNGKKSYDIL
ncbi:hypothetical protein HIM_11818 [Hirsutella minnesotensis 3608]|uniref:EGF domain-specific O-linked N-acetylglucosamine transferase n=1 Tax=Hirsutella minnesotensis 3608 TaxID=1043627 RepID=A0A0F7ZWD6_9HYPO|nr:hypothetical protein HIM_11818 [Hirsutella minnesotensis 3608]